MTIAAPETRADRRLAGKTALITGGARGLGAAICSALAKDGASVVAADVRTDLLHQLVSRMKEAGNEASALALDITDASACDAAVTRLVEDHGNVDILVNNAGIDITAPIEDIAPAEFDRILAVNLRAPFIISRAVLPHMKLRRSGAIVNIVSTAARRAWANASAYHATKWGLLGLSQALHVEARPHGIGVTAVIAGGMRTPFLFERFPDLDPDTLQPPENVAETVRWVLTQPPGTVIPEVTVLPYRETSWP